jgi:hypothetical protein
MQKSAKASISAKSSPVRVGAICARFIPMPMGPP